MFYTVGGLWLVVGCLSFFRCNIPDKLGTFLYAGNVKHGTTTNDQPQTIYTSTIPWRIAYKTSPILDFTFSFSKSAFL